jgi:hypothetical protein
MLVLLVPRNRRLAAIAYDRRASILRPADCASLWISSSARISTRLWAS